MGAKAILLKSSSERAFCSGGDVKVGHAAFFTPNRQGGGPTSRRVLYP